MREDLPEISLQPGEVYLSRRPAILKTILGSCVGVTFWSARLQAGALCHGILPLCPPHTGATEGYRYVDFSIRYLAGQFDLLGAARQELEIKVFGGADVLPVAAVTRAKPTVGVMNCQAALAVLATEGLRVGASDLGGTRGRTLRFHTGTGEVLLQRLARLPAASRAEIDPAAGPGRKRRLFL